MGCIVFLSSMLYSSRVDVPGIAYVHACSNIVSQHIGTTIEQESTNTHKRERDRLERAREEEEGI